MNITDNMPRPGKRDYDMPEFHTQAETDAFFAGIEFAVARLRERALSHNAIAGRAALNEASNWLGRAKLVKY